MRLKAIYRQNAELFQVAKVGSSWISVEQSQAEKDARRDLAGIGSHCRSASSVLPDSLEMIMAGFSKQPAVKGNHAHRQ
jgi:hypothetical protein